MERSIKCQKKDGTARTEFCGQVRAREKTGDMLTNIQILLEKIIGFSVIFLISFWIKKVGQTILFVFYFSCIRKRAGGFHANSFIG